MAWDLPVVSVHTYCPTKYADAVDAEGHTTDQCG